MTGTRNITKSLGVMEDLSAGLGKVLQTRGIGTKIDIPFTVMSLAELREVDYSKFPRARIYSELGYSNEFVYSADSEVGIKPFVGAGSWLPVDAQSGILDYLGARVTGYFSEGFTFNSYTDVGVDDEGSLWYYTGSNLPFVVDAGTNPEGYNYFEKLSLSSVGGTGNSLSAKPLVLVNPPNETVVLPVPVSFIQVEVDGLLLPPTSDHYDIVNDGLGVDIKKDISKSTVVIRYAMITKRDDDYVVFDTVQDMVENFTTGTCTTLAYNKPVVSMWRKMTVAELAAGDMSDATLALDKGGYAKLQIDYIMDVRAFGAYGDYDPVTMPAMRVGDDFIGYAHDDSEAFNNAVRNCDNVVSRAEDSFAIANHINCSYDNKTCDFSKSKFYWFGRSGAPVAVGRDRAMFEIHGALGDKIQESGVWEIWREGADTFPSPDTSVLLAHEFILMAVGNIPDGPGETYMIRPSLADYRKTNVETRFQSDYRLGWTHEQATFRYFETAPVKNTNIKLNYVKDMTDYDYDERDVDGNRMSASATAMVCAYNCNIACNESDNWQYPTVMTYVVSDCAVSNIRLLPSQRESLSGVYGWGIAVQWNTALRPRSFNLSGQGNRRILDYTQAAYAYAENVGGESTRDGEMTTHGVYEHNLTYVNTRGFMSFANSGPDFGESTKDITVIHHHGSDVFAVTNVQNLSLHDVRANSIRVNSVGLKMDNCSLYDSGRPNIDNLCQINNWSKKIGKPYEPANAVISKSILGSNGVVNLVDSDMDENDTIIFDECELYLREGDFAGNCHVQINGGSVKPKPSEVNNGRLILVSNPASLKIDSDGYNVGFRVPDLPFIANGPVNVDIRGTFVGDNFVGAFWANEDEGSIVGNKVRIKADIEWDNNTSSGVFYDPLKARNNNWFTEVSDSFITGKNNEELRIPALRGKMRFGNNTLEGVAKNIDTLSATRIEYNTLEL